MRAIVDMPMHMQPLQAKGWDMALLEYVMAIFTSSSPDCKPPTSSRLHEMRSLVLGTALCSVFRTLQIH